MPAASLVASRLARPSLPLGALLALLSVSGFGVLSGCSSWKLHSHWSPGGQSPLMPQTPVSLRLAKPGADPQARILWKRAGDAYERGESLALRREAGCVDEFYQAALLAWASHTIEHPAPPTTADDTPALRLYHKCLGRLIYEGQECGRLKPSAGLKVRDGDGWRVVPMSFHGFAWRPEDFRRLLVVGSYHSKTLKHEVTCEGIGVPLVVGRSTSKEEKPTPGEFVPPQVVFAATAFLRPDGESLDLYNPLNSNAVEFNGTELPLAKDLSASVAFALHFHESSRIEDFLQPFQNQSKAQLIFLEPYQPDKIPLIFLHGLLSDPRTWAGVYNELRGCPDIIQRYQVWAFKYPTGQSFLYSASFLREQLDLIAEQYDPDGQNPALRQAVLVGHSMGGLVAKLQATYSGDSLWYTNMRIPLEAVATTDETRALLAKTCFFDPHPLVGRVVFVATPHHGSAMAHGTYGRLATALIQQSNPQYDQVRRDNPGALKPHVEEGLPTSIDMLDPDSPLLRTLRRMRVGERIKLHSIVGHGRPSLRDGDSDGIVPVTSARHPCVESELMVRATHSKILAHPETVTELKRILRLHAAELDEACLAGEATVPATSLPASPRATPVPATEELPPPSAARPRSTWRSSAAARPTTLERPAVSSRTGATR